MSGFSMGIPRAGFPATRMAYSRKRTFQKLSNHVTAFRRVSTGITVDAVPRAHLQMTDIGGFRTETSQLETPLVLVQYSLGLPAVLKWFERDTKRTPNGIQPATNLSAYFRQFATAPASYELTIAPLDLQNHLSNAESGPFPTPWSRQLIAQEVHTTTEDSLPAQAPRFHRFTGPLALFLDALSYNLNLGVQPLNTQKPTAPPLLLTQLYIAQSDQSELPSQLRADLPAPDAVRRAGRGDLYGASLWLGLQPTYTPWHRDPNPNLLCQLCGRKTLRMLPPGPGEALFRAVQDALRHHHDEAVAEQPGGPGGGAAAAVSSRFRGEEMMQGLERRLSYARVWDEQPAAPQGMMIETELGPGDAVFIPKGWWHSVKSSAGVDGRLNASANWWFR